MNSQDPWRSIVGRHHGGGGGGGHHHHHNHGGGTRRPRRYFNSGYDDAYPYYWPYDQDPNVFVDNRQYYGGEQQPPQQDQYQSDPNDGSSYGGDTSVMGDPVRRRDGLLAQVAPVLAPATGGVTARFDLDNAHRLSALVTVDGKTYQGTVDLAPIIAALMMKLATARTQAPTGEIVSGDDCGARLFYGVTVDRLNAIMKRLVDEGADITGSNPWSVVTHNHGVELRGTWNRGAQTLLLEVTNTDSIPLVDMCSAVWNKLDEMLLSMGVSRTPVAAPAPGRQQPTRQPAQAPSRPVPSGNQAILAIDRAIAAARASLVESLVQQHSDTVSSGWLDNNVGVVSSGWFDSLKHAAGKAVHGIGHAGGAIKATLKKYRGPISNAAGLAAGSAAGLFGGPAAGVIANKLANHLVHAAAGDGSAKQALLEARTEAQRDPKLAKVLGTAEKAVAQTTAAYHIAETARQAQAGDANAANEIGKIDNAAQQGDKAAQIAMQLANRAADAGQDNQQTNNQPAVSGEIPFGSLDEYRQIAMNAVREARRKRSGRVLGYRRDGRRQRVYFFPSWNDAMAWHNPIVEGNDFDYIALFDNREPKRELQTPTVEQVGGWTKADPLETAVSGPAARPIVRIPVLVDGNLSKMFALWVLPYKAPSFYILDSNPAWLFEDHNGEIELGGVRYRMEYPITKPTLTGDVPAGIASQAVSAAVGTGGPRVEIIGAVADPSVANALATVRKQASDAALGYPVSQDQMGRVVGVVRWSDGNWALEPFRTQDEADDWLGQTTNQPHLFTYAAYFDRADASFPHPVNEIIGHGRARAA